MKHRLGNSIVAMSVVSCMGLLAAVGCSKHSETEPVESRPTEKPTDQAEESTTDSVSRTEPPATRAKPPEPPAAVRPAPEPETQPASSYRSEPPYPVKLYVRDPKAEQPGWLRIMELEEPGLPATADGSFPEHNRIYVDTSNVKRLRLHISHLPLAERKSIILIIDERSIQLARKKRKYVYLERSPAGLWDVVDPEKR